jgi:hypothetical protein
MPTPELADRILATCAYADRLDAGRFTGRVGIMSGNIRSVPELYLYLTPDERSLPAVSFERLADWIEHVVMDAELGAAAREAEGRAESYVDTCIAVHALVGSRLAQARAVLGYPVAGTDDVTETRP